MIIFVVSGKVLRSACLIRASVAVSTALVLSSRMRIFGCFKRARAMQRRCFCPPEIFTPPCPKSVSYPLGNVCTNSSASAAIQALRISSSVASSFPQRRFSFIVPLKSTFFCSTIATLSLSVTRSYFRTSMPPTLTVPDNVSYKRGMSETSVDFEEPVPPSKPTTCPLSICRFTSSSTTLLASFV